MSVIAVPDSKRRRDPHTGIEYELNNGQWDAIDPHASGDGKCNGTPKLRSDEPPASQSYSSTDLRVRSFVLKPETWDESQGRVFGVIATDSPVFSTDLATNKRVLEVWRIDGIEPDNHIPLLDNHKRDSVDNIKGSIRDTAPIDEHHYGGWLYVSESEPKIRKKIAEGHVKELSAGMQPLKTTAIQRGQTQAVRCRNGEAKYTAPADQTLNVHTSLLLREVSLPVKGSDSNTQIRSDNNPRKELVNMTSQLRKLCERLGMPKSHTEEEAKKWHAELPEQQRTSLVDWAKEEEDEEAHRKRSEEESEKKKKEEEDEESRKRSATASTESIRAEINAALKARDEAETKRVESIRTLGEGIEDEVVRKAIDDGLTVEQCGPIFLEAIRNRTCSIAIHSRSAEKDATTDVLGAALVLRTLSQLPSNAKGTSFASDPVQLLARMAPTEFSTNGIGEWRSRSNPVDTLNEDAKKRNYELLNKADRYRHLSIPDIMAHCVRLDGHWSSGFASRSEVVRAGLSGGSFGAIFTSNFNAMFLSGYLEAADTTLGWVTEDEAPNFMTGEVGMAGKMTNLTLAGRAPANKLTYGDWNEPIKVDRYTGSFEIDEQDLINDRFGVLQSNSPQEMGLAARRLRPNLIYSLLLGGYTASTSSVVGSRGPILNQDTAALFCSAHKNFLPSATYTTGSPVTNDIYNATTGAVGIAGLQYLYPLIQAQRLNGVPLNLKPRFVICSEYLDIAMRVALFSTQRIVTTGSGGTLNPFEAFGLEIRSDSRFDDVGSVNPLDNNKAVAGQKYHYLLVCRPGEEGAKTAVCRYLEGTGRAPVITSYALNGANNSDSRWGIKWAVKHDIGATAADYRGFAYAESTT